MAAPAPLPTSLQRSIPPCRGLNPECRSLRVTLRVGSFDEDSASLDHESTWLMGHTERITFLSIWEGEGDLYVDAVLHVDCRFLDRSGSDARCRAHGFSGPIPRDRPRPQQPRRLGGNRFIVVDDQRSAVRILRPPPRSLPVLTAPAASAPNPCAVAPCRTSDHVRGAACCRDLQIEIMCTPAQRRLEALVRSRRAPYLCKVEREGDYSIGVEMISACDYLEDDRVSCSLHGRNRADGRPAKPDLCSEWPERKRDLHPGCVFSRPRRR